MIRPQPDVVVLGAGVSGLTTAVCLAEQGCAVAVRAHRPPARTTSAVAGAIWGPVMVDHERVHDWSMWTHRELTRLAGRPHSGVRLVHGVEAARTVIEPPEWATEMASYERCAPDDLPAGFHSGWQYTAPVINMPAYLRYLVRRLITAGGTLAFGDVVTSLGELAGAAPIVVNCAGLGARELVGDDRIAPVRGQLVVVDNPGIDRFFVEYTEVHGDMTYFLPQGDHVILGGSAEPGRADPEPDPRVSTEIIARCAAIVPALGRARVREQRVGVRPSRHQVRVEYVEVAGVPVIHNYGHGGAGVSLSWGCARDVAEIVHDLRGATVSSASAGRSPRRASPA